MTSKMQIVMGTIGACTGLGSMALGYFENVGPSMWLGSTAFVIGVSAVYFSRRRP